MPWYMQCFIVEKSTHRTSQASHRMGKQLQVKMDNTGATFTIHITISVLILVGAYSKSFGESSQCPKS